ncbi:MAG: helix-turn-helix transcriptional regulator [Colwellia sp.]|nr:helix-turn-helix transcriptional regulator [Colwellia sp.]
MYLSFIDIFDLFLRFLAVGQLFLLCNHILAKQQNLIAILAVSVNIGLAAYLLLTAPIPDHYYGILRGILLFFTEIAPYLLWMLVLSLFRDNFHPMKFSLWIKTLISLILIWFLYFFIYMKGRGSFHQVNHLVELFFIFHIIFITVKEFPDDLVEARRNARLVTIVYTCIYSILILLLELGNAALRDSTVFSLLNAGLVLISTSFFSWHYFKGKFTDKTKMALIVEHQEGVIGTPAIPLVFKNVNKQLSQLMLEGFYKETQLSIKQLANKLKIPEHQLRELINKHLGFRNFPDFLSSYRIPAACAQFEDIAYIRKPILTIALELGYGSIATFNRTFKAQKGMTPKEYRSKFQK